MSSVLLSTPPRLLRSTGALLFMATCCAALARADNNVEMMLVKMNKAIHSTNYFGTYVHIHQHQVEAMRIFHSVGDRGKRDRLVSLNGEAREVLRDGNQVTCILPAERLIIVGKPNTSTGLPATLPDDISRLTDIYDINLIGHDRVAEYPAVVLSIAPKDKMRYGYRVWLERDSGMLLRSDILNNDGHVMEQMMFTQISMQTPVTETMLQPTMPYFGFRKLDMSAADPAARDNPADKPADKPARAESPWAFNSIPKGFQITGQTRKRMPMKNREVEHIILSDGLVTISVYIEKVDGENGFEGLSTMGGISAYGRLLVGHQVTVMGEAPAETVRQIAYAVSRAAE